MSKLSTDKKFYIILSVVVFFGFSGLGLAGWYIWDQRQSDKATAIQETPQVSEKDPPWVKQEDEQNKRLYDQCLQASDKSYNAAFAQIPNDLTPEQKLLAAQMLAQTHDSHKADCDRQYQS